MNEKTSAAADSQMKVISGIVQHLKAYPFLLITIAGLVILTVVFAFDLEKLKEFKWLLYGIVFAPLLMQFYFETKKHNAEHKPREVVVQQSDAPQPVVVADRKFSGKAIGSAALVVMSMMAMGDSTEEELMFDEDLQTGLLAFAAIGFYLGWSGLKDIKDNRAKGKGLAWAGMILSALLLLSTFGWMGMGGV